MKSSLIRARDALLDRVAPRKWLLVRKSDSPDEPFLICSSHRTRAAAVLAIPVDAHAYGVMNAENFQWMSAWAAFSDAPNILPPKENQ